MGSAGSWFAAPLVLAALCLLVVRWGIGFQFPVPWPDETSFVSPAFNFALTGSLFDPGLNPDRLVLWMPPGYMLFLAGFFRIFGYGFGFARWPSAACVLASLALAARIAWHQATGVRRVAAGWMLGLAFVSPYLLVSGNIARMEALFCCLMLVALSCGLAGRAYVMAALVAAGALVHFNAIYFVPAVALEFAARRMTGRLPRPGPGGRCALVLSAAGLMAYALFVALNWPAFLADMHVQFANKSFAGLDDPAHPAWMLWAVAGLLLANPAALRRAGPPLLLALFGAGFVVMAHYGRELWYDYGQPLGFALLALSFLGEPPAARWARHAVLLGGCVAIALAGLAGFRITPFMRPLLPQPAMLTHPFLPRGEIARIRAFIATLHPGDTVLFGWTGVENFFLADLARVGAHWVLMQHSATQTLPLRAADWNIDCQSSRLFPRQRMYDFSFAPDSTDGACRIVPVSLAARSRAPQ